MTATAVARERFVVTEPGVIYDMDDATYHGDPVPEGSLSSSGARRLLPPSCPALFKHWRDNPEESSATLDLGKAAHQLVLGTGPELVVIDADDWRTRAAQQQRDEARLAGKVPLLRDTYAEVQAMAAALRAHPVASKLFDPDSGSSEVSLFWRDEATKVMCRSRLDRLPTLGPSRIIIGDYKTAVSAEPAAFGRKAADYGYHIQAPFYVDGVRALELAEDVAFVFVVQEKTAPYLVTICELDSLAMRIGREAIRKALDVYAECMTADRWPGYSDDVELVSLPRWAEFAYEQETA